MTELPYTIGEKRRVLMEIRQSFHSTCRVARMEIQNFARASTHVAHLWKRREKNVAMLPCTSELVSEERLGLLHRARLALVRFSRDFQGETFQCGHLGDSCVC